MNQFEECDPSRAAQVFGALLYIAAVIAWVGIVMLVTAAVVR